MNDPRWREIRTTTPRHSSYFPIAFYTSGLAWTRASRPADCCSEGRIDSDGSKRKERTSSETRRSGSTMPTIPCGRRPRRISTNVRLCGFVTTFSCVARAFLGKNLLIIMLLSAAHASRHEPSNVTNDPSFRRQLCRHWPSTFSNLRPPNFFLPNSQRETVREKVWTNVQ